MGVSGRRLLMFGSYDGLANASIEPCKNRYDPLSVVILDG